jgi:hypothetical protein
MEAYQVRQQALVKLAASQAAVQAVRDECRQAALLEGVRIGLAAAADDAATWFPEATTGKYRAGGVVGSIRSLDPVTVLARHGGA